MSSSDNSSKPLKEQIYGEWLRTSRWRDDLYRRAAHKSLDVPEEEMITVNRSGITWREIAAVGALALGGGYLFHATTKDEPPPPPAIEQPAVIDTDTTLQIEGRKWLPPTTD
jgi:hypothetical protein